MSQSEFVQEWTKVIARAWVDPNFKSHLEASPEQVLASYGIHKVGGYDVDNLAGHISVVDASGGSSSKPHMDGDQLVIPLPAPPKSYDQVVDPDSVEVAGAGTATSIMEQQEAMVGANGYGLQVGSKEYSAGGQTIASTNITSQEQQNQSHSLPSVPSLDDDDDDDDEAGSEAGEDAGADAGEAVGEAATEGGADAAADAAISAAALCA